MSLKPRVVVVHRHTELDELLARHATRGQAAFFLSTRGRQIEDVEERHAAQQDAMATVANSIPLDWRRGDVERGDLPRFIFTPDDIVVVVGQDGLVANVAKYLDGQPVLGINPDPARNPGLLVPDAPASTAHLFDIATSPARSSHCENRTMVQAVSDDGQTLVALNEVFVGHPSHQSARYSLHVGGSHGERQSSSGLIVSTGTGATGWCRSAWMERHSGLALPEPQDTSLVWFVREAWPSPATGTELTEGELGRMGSLRIVVESDVLVAFGDGIEADSLQLSWGQTVTVSRAKRQLHLLHSCEVSVAGATVQAVA